MSIPFESRCNSFTFLRTLLALAVVFGHAFVIAGFGEEPLGVWTRGAITGREVAVQGFFVLSGFLIAKSLDQSPSLLRFAVHRVARIFPGYWAWLLVFVAVVFPALVSARLGGSHGYFQLVAAAVNFAPLLPSESPVPGLLAGNPQSGAINGSLWSVEVELRFYAWAAAAALAARIPFRFAAALAVASLVSGFWSKGMLGAAAVAILGGRLLPAAARLPVLFGVVLLFSVTKSFAPGILAEAPDVVLWLLVPVFQDAHLACAAAFTGGMMAWRFRARIPWSRGAFTVALGALCAAAFVKGVWLVVMAVALPLVLVWLAFRLPFQRFERLGDWSYGIYLFSFPIQQLLVHAGVHKAGLLPFLGASVLLSVAAGVVSWFVIERPALAAGRRAGAWFEAVVAGK